MDLVVAVPRYSNSGFFQLSSSSAIPETLLYPLFFLIEWIIWSQFSSFQALAKTSVVEVLSPLVEMSHVFSFGQWYVRRLNVCHILTEAEMSWHDWVLLSQSFYLKDMYIVDMSQSKRERRPLVNPNATQPSLTDNS